MGKQVETITTHDIRVGDVILSNGMRLRVDHEPRQTDHPVDAAGITLVTDAVIENWDELVQRAESDKWVAGFIVNIVRSDMSPTGHRARNALAPYAEPRWTIQGNGWAHWTREIAEG